MPRAIADQPLPPVIVVAAALVDEDGRVLMQQRPIHKAHGGLWEFPGGKVEPGETPEKALVRELREELDLAVDVADVRPLDFAADRKVILLLFECRRWQGEASALAAAALRWEVPARLASLPMPPLDVPLVQRMVRGRGAGASI